MNHRAQKILATILLAGFVAGTGALAETVSPAQFYSRVNILIADKEGGAAAHAAAKYFGATITIGANRRNVREYAKSVIKALKESVPLTSGVRAPTAINLLVRTLLTSYFRRGKTFNLRDMAFNQALAVLLKGLPPSAKTSTTYQRLRDTVTTIALQRGVSPDEINAYLAVALAPPVGPCGCSF